MGQHNSKRGNNADVFAWPKADGGGRSSSNSDSGAHARAVAAAADSAERDAVTRHYRACLLAGQRAGADADVAGAGDDADDEAAAAVVAAASAAAAAEQAGGEAATSFAATFPTLASFACYWAVPPPVVLADADGAWAMWRRQCLGVTWRPSEKTAPGLSALRWYVPPPPPPRGG
eukprot:Rhum_TRINITY_DN11347_c0_g1::Rhum_TRINITY_DN11347_c0_g1_i1::g.44118::m.44118